MQDLAKRLDAGDHAGDDVRSMQHGAVHLEHRLPGEAGQFTQKASIEAEEEAQALGHREHKLAVGHGLADVTGDVFGHDEGPLLVATGTQTAAAAGEGDEELVAAVGVSPVAPPMNRPVASSRSMALKVSGWIR